MTALEHLIEIEKLAFDRATPAEFKPHIIAIQETLEAQERELDEARKNAAEHLKLKAAHRELYLRSIENKRTSQDDPPNPSWPSSGIIHDF